MILFSKYISYGTITLLIPLHHLSIPLPSFLLYSAVMFALLRFPAPITTSLSDQALSIFHKSSRRTPCGRMPLAESGLTAFPHPALCETNRSHLSIVYTDIVHILSIYSSRLGNCGSSFENQTNFHLTMLYNIFNP